MEVKVSGSRSPGDAELGGHQDDSRPGEGADARKGSTQLSFQLEAWLCHPPYISFFEMEHGAPEIRTKAPPTALVSMTQIPPPTASSCVFLNVCVPGRWPRQSMRLSAVSHACTGMSPHVHTLKLCPSAYLSPSLRPQNMTNRVNENHNVSRQQASYVQGCCAEHFTCSTAWSLYPVVLIR